MSEEKTSKMSKQSHFTIELAGAAIFGALSIIIAALTAPILPRIPGWGIAFFDPVSIIWVTCFLIFGTRSGVLCSIIGMVGLMFVDPTAPIGPTMKLVATIALLLGPILVLKLYKLTEAPTNSQKLKNPKNYVVSGIIGITIRIGIMMVLNILLFLTILGGIQDWTFVIVYVILINVIGSIGDLVVPYLIVFGLKLDERFAIW